MTNEQKIYIRRTKAYKVIMSNGDPIQVEQEEIEKVLAGAQAKGLIVVKRGIINPAFIVSVVDDKDRLQAWHKQTNYSAIEADGTRQGDKYLREGLKPLDVIFEGTIARQLKASAVDSAKKLGMEVSDKSLLENK